MNAEVLQKLQGLGNAAEVGKALAGLSRPYGQIVRVDVVSTGGDMYICFVDLATARQNAALYRGLGGFAYGRGVGFCIPVKAKS